jgi:hypothetical protein
MPNPNKNIEGLEFIEYSSNMSCSWGGLKFPESHAADYMGGSHALFFSGKDYDGRDLDTVNFGAVSKPGFGPRGVSGAYEAVSPIFGLNPNSFPGDPPANHIYSSYDGMRYISGCWDSSVAGGGAQNAWESGFQRVTAFDYICLGHDRNTPKLHSKFGMGLDFAAVSPYVATGGSPPSYFTNQSRTDVGITSITTISTLDIIGEGPIEGLVTGNYIYNLNGKKAGDIGYTSVSMDVYFTGSNNLGTNPLVGTNNPEARSIFWNQTPIANEKGYLNFQYINYKFNNGEPNIHTISNPKILLYEDRYHWDGYQVDLFKYPLPIQTSKVINEKLRGASAYDGLGSGLYFPNRYYIYNTDVEALRINFKVEALYWQPITGSNSAETSPRMVMIQLYLYRLFKDGTTSFASMEKLSNVDPYLFSADAFRIQGKVQSPTMLHYTFYVRSHADNGFFFEILPNQVGWMIRIDKPVYEDYSIYVKNTTVIESITEVYHDRFIFPNTACVWSKYDARYFSDVPERSYRARLLKVKIPNNYDPILKTYNGNWNGQFKLAWTDNPAWCYYDIITNNRYGLGKYLDSSLVDKWTLYEVSKYCDTLVPDGNGGLEPRFTCNVLLTSKEEAYKILDDMASIFNGLTYYSAGQIFVTQDAPKDPIYLFNNSNVVNGDFTYSDSSKRLRRSVALIRYNDSTNNFKPAIEYIEDRNSLQKYGIREAEVTAFGCTRPNQARRLGKWFLKSENLETETVEFKAGLEGHFLKPGDVISIFDQNRKNNIYAGRTLDLKTGSATLDLSSTYLNTLTGAQGGNSIKLSFLTPSYTLERGTDIGNLYITGFDANSSGISGLNSTFFRNSQIQTVIIQNPNNYFSGNKNSNGYSGFIDVILPTALNTSGYYLPKNTPWTIEVTGYNTVINAKSQINNPSSLVYPGYYLEPLLDKPKPYRIVNIQEIENKIFSITALEYVFEKYLDIETGASLASVDNKIPTPSTPFLEANIIYRNPLGGYLDGSNTPFTTYQANGINSISYYITGGPNSGIVSRYLLYKTSGTTFKNDPPYQSELLAIKTNDSLNRSGLGYAVLGGVGGASSGKVDLPDFFTPLGAGTFYLRCYAENALGERSPYAEKVITLTQQSALSQDQLQPYNVQ